MTTLTLLEHTKNSSNLDSYPIDINIKQEVIEENETVFDPSSHVVSVINNEFNIKEEVDFDVPDSEVDVYNFDLVGITEKQFECKYCHFKCFTLVQLMAHSVIHTESPFHDDKLLFCVYCTYKTKRRSHLNDHLRSHTGDKPYMCKSCDYRSGLKGNLKRHISRIHTAKVARGAKVNAGSLQCAHCTYTCSNKSHLIRHVKMHPKILTEKYNLRSLLPLKYDETSPPQTPPDVFEKQDSPPEYIDIHSLNVDFEGNLMAAHSNVDFEGDLMAAHSNIDFEEAAPLKYETSPISPELFNERNMYKCNECKYTCIRKTHLNDHLKTHSGEKPFVCVMCNYRTGHKSHLTRHLKVHIKKEGSFSKLVLRPPIPAKKQVYKCLLCGYKSQIKHCFAKHMRLHIGVALYECNICDFQTKSNLDIKTHIKIHEDERQFHCFNCQYKSKNKGRLRRHVAIHNILSVVGL